MLKTENNVHPATIRNAERATRKALPGPRLAELRKGIRRILASIDPVAGLASHLSDATESQRVHTIAAELAADIERDERVERSRQEARDAIQANKCPQCGRPVRRNLSITGWIQCSQFGSVGFRANAELPPCEWQGFTC